MRSHTPGEEHEDGSPQLNPSEPQDDSSSKAVSNPLASAFDFRLSMPEIEVKMINAATLGDFEVWLYSASLAFSAIVGFLVAYLQSFRTDSKGAHSDGVYLVVAIMFILLFIGFGLRALMLRRQLRSATKTYKMRAIGESDS